MYTNDAESAGTMRFLCYSKVYVISGLVISRDDLYSAILSSQRGVVKLASKTATHRHSLFYGYRGAGPFASLVARNQTGVIGKANANMKSETPFFFWLHVYVPTIAAWKYLHEVRRMWCMT